MHFVFSHMKEGFLHILYCACQHNHVYTLPLLTLLYMTLASTTFPRQYNPFQKSIPPIPIRTFTRRRSLERTTLTCEVSMNDPKKWAINRLQLEVFSHSRPFRKQLTPTFSRKKLWKSFILLRSAQMNLFWDELILFRYKAFVFLKVSSSLSPIKASQLSQKVLNLPHVCKISRTSLYFGQCIMVCLSRYSSITTSAFVLHWLKSLPDGHIWIILLWLPPLKGSSFFSSEGTGETKEQKYGTGKKKLRLTPNFNPASNKCLQKESILMPSQVEVTVNLRTNYLTSLLAFLSSVPYESTEIQGNAFLSQSSLAV